MLYRLGEAQASISVLFSGKERDTESGNDYFGARYYASSMGRFMSPDPGWFMAMDVTNPQSLNLYSYALNNPFKFIDPTGMVLCHYGQNDDGSEDYEDADDENECTSNGGTVVQDQQSVTVTPQPSDPPPSCSDFTGPLAPPAGPINYRATAQANAATFSTASRNPLYGPWSLFQAFKTGGSQDFKGNSAFGTRTNQVNAGNFNFGATMAAMGKTLSGAAFWAGVGAELSNGESKANWAMGQSAYMNGQYGGPSAPANNPPPPASTVGPGSPGSPDYAPNTGLMNQGDQDATNENEAVALGFVWYSMGCTQ
jgi:RHS repeat-associated protein